MIYCSKWTWFFSVFLCIEFLLGGCGIPEDAQLSGETRTVRDGMGNAVTLPLHPKRVVSVGVSSDDVLIPILGTKRIVAISELPPNLEKKSEEIKGRISGTTESVISQAPDLVVVPSWQKAEYVDEIRSAGVPVYVYQMPNTVEGMIAMIHELAGVVGEEEKGNELAAQTEERVRRLDDFQEGIPPKKNESLAYLPGQMVSLTARGVLLMGFVSMRELSMELFLMDWYRMTMLDEKHWSLSIQM